MIRKLAVYEMEMPTVHIMKSSEGKEQKTRFVLADKVTPSMIDESDVVVLIRPTTFLSYQIAKKAHRAGRFVISFFDDDLVNRPSADKTVPWTKKYARKTLGQSDAVWSCSPRIAEKYRSLTFGKRSGISDTIIEPNEFRNREKTKSDLVRVVYAAAPSHAPLFMQLIEPVLPRLWGELGNFSLTFIGVHPELDRSKYPGLQVEYVDLMPFDRYREYMADHDFDLGLAPIHDDEFSRCKYYNKYHEYSIFQIAAAYTGIEPYTYVVKDKVNGFLADNTEKSWYTTLRSALEDSDLRDRCAESAFADVKTSFSRETVEERKRSLIPELSDFHAPEGRKCGSLSGARLLGKILYILDRFYISGLYLMECGPVGLVRKIRQHFEEKRAYSGN